MNKNTKRITLGSLAAVAAVAIPIATVASCGFKSENHEGTRHRTMDTWGWSKKITALNPTKMDRSFSFSMNKDTTNQEIAKQDASNMDGFIKKILSPEELKEYTKFNQKLANQKPTNVNQGSDEDITNDFVYSTRTTYEQILLPINKAITKNLYTFTYTTKAGKKIVSTIDLTQDTLNLVKNIENLLKSIRLHEAQFKYDAESIRLTLDVANYNLKMLEYNVAVATKFGNTKIMQEMIKETGKTKDQILEKLFMYSYIKKSVDSANAYLQRP